MYIFQADCFCDDCGAEIKKRLDGEGKTPSDPENYRSFDSDDYPKYADDDDSSDSPQHCGSHEDCLNAEVLPSGRKIGCLISNNLTEAGVEYVKEKVAEGGEVADFWREQFDWIDFPEDEDEDA